MPPTNSEYIESVLKILHWPTFLPRKVSHYPERNVQTLECATNHLSGLWSDNMKFE